MSGLPLIIELGTVELGFGVTRTSLINEQNIVGTPNEVLSVLDAANTRAALQEDNRPCIARIPVVHERCEEFDHFPRYRVCGIEWQRCHRTGDLLSRNARRAVDGLKT